MFSFVLAVGSLDGVPCRGRVDAMVGRMNFSQPEATALADVSHASTAITRRAVVDRDRLVAPHWDEERQLLFSGDVRLYNRNELADRLGLNNAGRLSDLDLARFAYLRWGTDTPRHLVGDFAFAAWDERKRTLFAARDQLGVRPLYFRVLADGILLASDISQMLPLLSSPFDDVNAEQILDFFAPPARRSGQTYFRSISLLRPGHSLTWAASVGHRETRYWIPPSFPTSQRSYEDNCDELLRLFRRSVRDRLDSDHPIIAHASGGFDSSTILMAADDMYREPQPRPPLIMASAITPGFPCDDSRYMHAVASRVQFEGVKWPVLDDGPADLHLDDTLTYPSFRRGPGGGPKRDLELATERGARVLVGGQCGDDVLFAGGIFLDLLRHGRCLQLLKETGIFRGSLARASRLLLKATLGALPPLSALELRTRFLRRSRPWPNWFGPRLRELPVSPSEALDLADTAWPSHVALDLWFRITGPQVGAVINSVVHYGWDHGIEVRLPFADVRIVEHLLSFPWEQRIPKGYLRRTGRDALGRILPPEFALRRNQGPWTEVWEASARRALPVIADVIEHGPWHSAGFVNRLAAQTMLRDAIGHGTPSEPTTWTLLLNLAALESWLRRLFCYNAPREVETCRNV